MVIGEPVSTIAVLGTLFIFILMVNILVVGCCKSNFGKPTLTEVLTCFPVFFRVHGSDLLVDVSWVYSEKWDYCCYQSNELSKQLGFVFGVNALLLMSIFLYASGFFE